MHIFLNKVKIYVTIQKAVFREAFCLFLAKIRVLQHQIASLWQFVCIAKRVIVQVLNSYKYIIEYIKDSIDNKDKKVYTYINYFRTILAGGTAVIEATI